MDMLVMYCIVFDAEQCVDVANPDMSCRYLLPALTKLLLTTCKDHRSVGRMVAYLECKVATCGKFSPRQRHTYFPNVRYLPSSMT
jgi:hypothetical protein